MHGHVIWDLWSLGYEIHGPEPVSVLGTGPYLRPIPKIFKLNP